LAIKNRILDKQTGGSLDILSQICFNEDTTLKEDAMKIKNYETFGVMIDMSRNAVMSVAQVKKYLGYLQKMGYNCR
jgi:hypothetical protein